MPIYRYNCKKCDSTVEIFVVRFDSEVNCPNCGESELEKMPSLIGAVVNTGPISCASRKECPSAGSHNCGGNCNCGGH